MGERMPHCKGAITSDYQAKGQLTPGYRFGKVSAKFRQRVVNMSIFQKVMEHVWMLPRHINRTPTFSFLINVLPAIFGGFEWPENGPSWAL